MVANSRRKSAIAELEALVEDIAYLSGFDFRRAGNRVLRSLRKRPQIKTGAWACNPFNWRLSSKNEELVCQVAAPVKSPQ